MKRALITGITGQDGSYLAELLLSKGYRVFGLYRRKSKLDYGNVNHIVNQLTMIEGDLTDQSSLVNAIKVSKPDEVYNLAALSFVGTSFNQPICTTEINALGVVNLLEAIRHNKPDTKFYQASTSELFGGMSDKACDEHTPFIPRSPYGVAKLYAHWITKNYRDCYNMFACAGILFNHESERRGKEFVTRKITSTIAAIKKGNAQVLELGNISTKRDWGHAEDYVRAMWLMLQQDSPNEYVIASGNTYSVRDFVKKAFQYAGYDIRFEGKDIDEFGYSNYDNKKIMKINGELFRPMEVNVLLGNPTKAFNELGWSCNITFDELIKRMLDADMQIIS